MMVQKIVCSVWKSVFDGPQRFSKAKEHAMLQMDFDIWLPDFRSKVVKNLMCLSFKWLQLDSNPQPLSS